MFEKILVPLDGSQLAERILPYVVELARGLHAEVTLFQVVESIGQAMATMTPAEPMVVSPVAIETVVDAVESSEDAAKAYMRSAAERLRTEGISVGWQIVTGSTADEILRYVEANGIGLIAISSHGRGGVARAVLGSVGDNLIRRAKIPVLIASAHKS